MTRVNPEAVRARLSSLNGTIDESSLSQAVRDLGRDGVVDGTDKALLDAFLPRMSDAARARYARLVAGAAPGATTPSLSSLPGMTDVAAGSRVLVRGNRGPEVKLLQESLIRLNFGSWQPTEFFGPVTEQALKEFQVHYNDRLGGTPSANARPLTVDGKLNKDTLRALDAELAAIPVQEGIGGGLDKADVVIDLGRQRAYVNAALIDPDKLAPMLAALGAEPQAASRPAYTRLETRVAPNGQPTDDYDALPVATEKSLGMKDSDGTTRTFVSFTVAVGEREGDGYLTPTGSFIVGDKRKNREATQWDHPKGFNQDPANPFGPRWMRLYREGSNGARIHTGYGLHGTTSTATWMNRADGARAVSHGCVRFRNEDILKMFQYIPDGARVRIVRSLPDGALPARGPIA